jgi:hypothetical protein
MCQLGNFMCLKLHKGIFVILHVQNYENAPIYKIKTYVPYNTVDLNCCLSY